MENKFSKTQKEFLNEEEKILNWDEVKAGLEKNFGSEIYKSWLKDISLLKEFNDYIIPGVPYQIFRDWIVSDI